MLTWNAGAERINGYRPDEIIGKHFSILYPEEDRATGAPARELAIARRNGRYEEEGIRVRKDGSRFCASVVLTALRDEHNHLIGFAKVTRDLSAQKLREEIAHKLELEQTARAAAQRAQVQLQTILEGVGDGILVQDRNGEIVFVNPEAARQSGFSSPAEMLATPRSEIRARFELVDEDGRPVPLESLPVHRALAGELTPSKTLGIREIATGRSWWSQVRATAIRDANGKPELAISILEDVSERRREEVARRYLYETTALLSASLDYEITLAQLARGLVPHFADWCAVDVLEEGALKRLAVAHVDPEKVAFGHEIHRRYPPDMSPGARGLATVLRTGEAELYPDVTDEMLVNTARDEEHLALTREVGLRSVVLAPIRSREATFGVLTLITAESGRRYDESDLALAVELGRRAGIAIENARLYRDATRAIELRDEFLSIAGHELRTPLAALDLQLEGLRRAFANGTVADDLAKWSQRLEKTITHSRRLRGLIDELLDVSRITGGRLELQREPFDLVALSREVIERHADLAARAGSRIELSHEGDALGDWDRSRLDQVLSNILGNAIKYGGGKAIAFEVRAAHGRAVVSIRDRGIGIAEGDHKRIFGRFERAVPAQNYGGLGLGLWISREIVLAHGGDIHFASKPGEGTTFTIELPLAAVQSNP